MLVRNSLREFGVATYHKSEVSPGGELSQIHMKAPSFHIIDHSRFACRAAQSVKIPILAPISTTLSVGLI